MHSSDIDIVRSRQVEVVQRLTKRYELEPGSGSPLQFLDPVIRLTTSADELLKTPGVVAGSVAGVTAPAKVTLLTVPQGKRWTYIFGRIVISGGTGTFNELIFVDASTGLEGQYDLVSPASTDYYLHVVNPIKMDEGDMFKVTVNAVSASVTIGTNAWVEQEDAFL